MVRGCAGFTRSLFLFLQVSSRLLSLIISSRLLSSRSPLRLSPLSSPRLLSPSRLVSSSRLISARLVSLVSSRHVSFRSSRRVSSRLVSSPLSCLHSRRLLSRLHSRVSSHLLCLSPRLISSRLVVSRLVSVARRQLVSAHAGGWCEQRAAAAAAGSAVAGSSRGVAHQCALEEVGGACEDPPGAPRLHGAHRGGAAAWERLRDGIACRVEPRERHAIGLTRRSWATVPAAVSAAVPRAALRGAATRWPWSAPTGAARTSASAPPAA